MEVGAATGAQPPLKGTEQGRSRAEPLGTPVPQPQAPCLGTAGEIIMDFRPSRWGLQEE